MIGSCGEDVNQERPNLLYFEKGAQGRQMPGEKEEHWGQVAITPRSHIVIQFINRSVVFLNIQSCMEMELKRPER